MPNQHGAFQPEYQSNFAAKQQPTSRSIASSSYATAFDMRNQASAATAGFGQKQYTIEQLQSTDGSNSPYGSGSPLKMRSPRQ